MTVEVWFAYGGWDDVENEPVFGGVMLEVYPSLEAAQADLPIWEVLAVERHGEGDMVVLSPSGDLLAGPVPCWDLEPSAPTEPVAI